MTDDSDATSWALFERLFTRALKLPPEEWEGFLKREAPGDPKLRQEILDTLRSSESAETYLLDMANRAGVPPSPGDQIGRLAGKRLGSWRLVELIGRGGMGAVYLAERDDEQFRMTAALKILPLGVSSDAQRRRFLSERQILARLNHPNIARILDGGVTEDGTPFFVMEHVEGMPVDVYCDEHRLSLTERLLLFEGVCEAVQHAHQKLVVHQDLKPGNILVTPEGQVKLLDFGIARMLGPDEGEAADLTGVQGQAMTLRYASPEQVRGEPVSTASDIYSLGLILYELLVGAHPYRHQITTPVTAATVVSEAFLPPPSDLATHPFSSGSGKGSAPEDRARVRGTHPARLKRTLTGDLDTIVLMALKKEPERRYGSVADLSTDLRNYRNRLPVSARPDAWTYRSFRFLQRNRFAITLGALAVLLTVGQVTVALRAAARDRAQAQIIQREASRAEAVTDFLVGLFDFTETQDGMADTIRARTLVNRGADRILTSLDDQPETKIQILAALSQVFGNLGLPDQELSLLEEGWEILETHSPEDELQRARFLRRIGDAHRGNRDFDLAEPFFERALEIYRRYPERRIDLAGTLLDFSATLSSLGKADSALVMNAEGIRIRQLEYGEGGLPTLRARADRGMVFRAAGEPDSARAIYDRVLPALREKGDSARYLLSAVLNNHGYLVRTQGDLAGAEALYRESLDLEREANLPLRLITLLGNLAAVLEDQGKLQEAEGYLLERIDVARDTWPEGHWRVGSVEGSLALFGLAHGNPGAALPHAERQLESYKVQIAEEHAWTNQARGLLGTCLLDLDRFQEAEPYLLHAYQAFADFGGTDHEATQALIGRLVTLYESWGRRAEAERFRGMLGPSR